MAKGTTLNHLPPLSLFRLLHVRTQFAVQHFGTFYLLQQCQNILNDFTQLTAKFPKNQDINKENKYQDKFHDVESFIFSFCLT